MESWYVCAFHGLGDWLLSELLLFVAVSLASAWNSHIKFSIFLMWLLLFNGSGSAAAPTVRNYSFERPDRQWCILSLLLVAVVLELFDALFLLPTRTICANFASIVWTTLHLPIKCLRGLYRMQVIGSHYCSSSLPFCCSSAKFGS